MPDLAAITERVVSWANSGEEVEVYASWDRELSVRVFEGEVEHLVSAESSGVGVRVLDGGRQGFAYTGALDDDALAETLAAARDNATFATVDEHAGLADPDGVDPATLDLWRDGASSMETSDKVAMALSLESSVRSGDPRIRQVESSNYADVAWEAAIASTAGIRAQSRGTGGYLFAYAIAEEDGDTRTGGGYSVGREPSELDIADAAGDAVERATRLLGAKKPRSERLVAVFDPRVSASLLGILAGTLSGDAVEKGRSLFAGRLGEKVGADDLTVVEDPTDERAYLAACFDAEGLATRRTVLVENGVLKRYLYDSYSARRAGVVSTASAVRGGFRSTPGVGARAVSCTPGPASQESIVAGIDAGILVTSITGVHSGVNPVSGDFSVGAEGVMIRNGTFAEPVKEATVASTIQRMLLSITAIGNDQEWLPGSTAGVTLAISDVALSGE